MAVGTVTAPGAAGLKGPGSGPSPGRTALCGAHQFRNHCPVTDPRSGIPNFVYKLS